MWTEDRKAELARELIARIRALSAPRRPVPAPVAARGGRLPGIRAVFFDVYNTMTVSYKHLRAHETVLDLVCRLLLEKKKLQSSRTNIHTTLTHHHTQRSLQPPTTTKYDTYNTTTR